MKDRIRQLMEAKRMNQQAFARFTKIGTASLSSIFTGRTRPTMNHVVAIMDAFPHVNPTWLIKGEGPMMIGEDVEVTSNPSQVIGETEESKVVEGDLFKENSFVESPLLEPAAVPVQSKRTGGTRRGVSDVGMITDNMTVSNHHITEIRVFFDDQTWQSFVPKK